MNKQSPVENQRNTSGPSGKGPSAVTAVPHDLTQSVDLSLDNAPSAGQLEYGEMNEEDARESGYIGDDGKAVSMAKPDVKGSPTGAYTDIGAGRSSVVHPHSEQDEDSADRH